MAKGACDVCGKHRRIVAREDGFGFCFVCVEKARRAREGRKRRTTRTSRDVYRRVSLKCRQCGRTNFLTAAGLNDHIRKNHVRESVKRADATPHRFSEANLIHAEKSMDLKSVYQKWKATYKANKGKFDRIHRLTGLEWGMPNYNGYLGKLRQRLVQLVHAGKIRETDALDFYIDILFTGT